MYCFESVEVKNKMNSNFMIQIRVYYWLILSLYNHELSVVWRPASLLLSLSSVDSPPVHMFDHRNFISCMHIYAYMPQVYAHEIFSQCDLYF